MHCVPLLIICSRNICSAFDQKHGYLLFVLVYSLVQWRPILVVLSGNISAIAETRFLCGDGLDFYSGEDAQIVPILSLGGIGVISVLSHLVPKQVHDMCALYFAGKTAESAALQIGLMDLIRAIFIDVNPIPVKEAVNLMGFAAGPCRMPLSPMDEKDRDVLIAAMKRHGLLA